MTTFGFASPDESPGFLLWQVTNRWQRSIRDALAPLGITHVQFVIMAGLAWLERNGSQITQIHLAHHARIDPMMTSQVVRTLVDKGLIERSLHPEDKRAWHVALTADGQRVTQEAVQLVEAADAAFFLPLQSQGPAFVSALQALRAET